MGTFGKMMTGFFFFFFWIYQTEPGQGGQQQIAAVNRRH